MFTPPSAPGRRAPLVNSRKSPRRGHPRRRDALAFAAVGKRTSLAIALAAGLALAPIAHAEAAGQPFPQFIAPYSAPVPLDDGSDCDPNYSGACVPVASDVDCAGGSGNGPAYVQEPVRVIGNDIYGLDRNGDGIGCES